MSLPRRANQTSSDARKGRTRFASLWLSDTFSNVRTRRLAARYHLFMLEGKYKRLYGTNWARAMIIILLLSIIIGSLLSWLESN
jgi:hypothetical protein